MVGLAVMGQNLILNLADHGYRVCAFNRTVSKVDEFVKEHPKIRGAHSLEEMVSSLKSPRCILLMVKAGEAVDEFIAHLLPLLSPGDIVIDGGNSHPRDTERRYRELRGKLLFVGMGVSGGEEGARHGPSLMPGGAPEAWPLLKEMLQAIAAKDTTSGEPCCGWVGEGGAGHFVKMVHNGIEYGDMQLIAEAYQLMRDALKLPESEMATIFKLWNQQELNSFLIEITGYILSREHVVPRILDRAGQKGTGKWTVEAALELGTPVTLIAEAVMARGLSALKEDRELTARLVPPTPQSTFCGDKQVMLDNLKKALLASKVVSYAQGFMLLQAASNAHGWQLDYGAIALLWRGGCIIRSAFLQDIRQAYLDNPNLSNLLHASHFQHLIRDCEDGWRRVVAEGCLLSVPLPAMTAALTWLDGYRCAHGSAGLIQAQRDYFGAHTFEWIDQPGKSVHFDWLPNAK